MEDPTPLHSVKRFITGHNSSGQAIYESQVPEDLPFAVAGSGLTRSLAYTLNNLPANLNANADHASYSTQLAELETQPAPLILPNGTALQHLIFAPGATSPMHRTVSLDYIVMLEGEVECILDGGETRLLRTGDVLVQRGTMHAWRNPSLERECRFVAVIHPIESVEVNGKKLEAEWTT
ncbi:cupin domain-containing protein [Patellaria atrata CBS 101060]|uniref:Cupin domain-containing protein n=1 Tax=Patellaria atrata CBS 101060 TaxID=1346257 RepID=A0A9P4VMQ1_9PEZI|nr:cupin domain-containing protein [Patellaria atrata CBS 101060]